MKRTLLIATTALAFAMTPAAAQVVGGEAEIDTDTNIDTDFADDGAETRTGVSTDIKVDPGEYDRSDSQAETAIRSSTDISADLPDALTDYEIGQIRKAGPEAVADIGTITRSDLTYE